MDMFNRISLSAALCALLSFSLPSGADEIQDANKLFKQGQNAQALEKVNGFLATKPKDAQARFLKGLIVNEQGNTTEAIKIFTELTDDYPELPEPYNNLAVLYAGKGQYEKAKVALEMAIRTHPSYATAHENLGAIYAKMASQAYDRALQLDKSNISTQTKLALIRDLFSKSPSGTKAVTASATTEVLPPAASSQVASASPVSTVPIIAAAASPTPFISTPIVSRPLVASDAAAPVVTPPPAKLEAAPVIDVNDEVLKATREWAAAWSAKNSKKYLAFYAREFKTPDGEDRSAWEAQRKERIAKPRSIQVEAHDAKVNVLDDQHASVSFKQSYRASHLKTSSSKTLLWVKTDGRWQIVEERSGK